MMEQQEEEQQIPYPVAQPMMGHTTEGALQYQLESIDAVDRIGHIIRGEAETRDELGNVIWKQQFKPMLNEKGLNMIRGYLTMFMGSTKTFALTDIEGEYIGDEVIDVGSNIKAELMDNWTEYGVKDYAAATFIINIVTAAIYAILKKGEDATYLKFLRTTQNIQEVQHHQAISQQAMTPRENNNLMGVIFGKKKRRF
jgi:hypothetical protein